MGSLSATNKPTDGEKLDGVGRMWIKKFLNVNINDIENVDKPEGGGGEQCG